ncbi:hypothetical protein BLS_003834 [Venturia inaequalis]|uniref:Saccharopine dehydrogenase NADP binding domain-containing protein n=1 Tax=Venturia inaequalis TaxID=5025 RepID=A0A8H3UNG0_VENIN|nr:hypothetical protein EG328_006003 [Venturia inaequalis]KAE9972885.1 hypothetical protein BLS_003834 [Venturia inaequalis]
MTQIKNLDIVLFGATGYTGRLAAEHIAKTFPISLKWAIAELVELELEGEALDALVARAHVVINGVGPYHRYSTPVLVACANAGTHYVDFSTETPWQKEMIDTYHETAKKNGAIIIPALSLASPSDLLAFLIATSVQKNHPGTAIEVVTAGKLELNGMQGGSFDTILKTMETYGTGWLKGDPWAFSPRTKPTSAKAPSVSERLTGHRFIPALGHLATSFVGISIESVVLRSAGLKPELYGPDFVYHEYLPVPNTFAAVVVQLLTKFGAFVLGLGVLRSLLRRLSFEPGSGPDLDAAREKESMDFQAVGIEIKTEIPLVRAQFSWKGSLTEISAILAAEASAVLLEKSKAQSEGEDFGILTPSTLGMPFVERLQDAGVRVTVSES